MRQPSRVRVFWDRVGEDRDLVFFFIGLLAWSVDFAVDVLKGDPPIWLVVRLAIPVFFLTGVVLYVRKHYRLAAQLVSAKHLPVVFVVGKPRDEAASAFAAAQKAVTAHNGFSAFRQMEDSFNVRWDYMTPHRPDRLGSSPAEWKRFIEDAQRDIHRFCDAVPGEKTYHIFIYGPASLALGLGAAFGTKRRVVVYQPVDGRYKPVLDLSRNVRAAKQYATEAERKYVRVSYPEVFTTDTAVVLDMASHAALGDTKAYLKRKSQPMELVEVINTYGGNLTEDDWVGVVQEMYSVFGGLQRKPEVARLHLFHSMPVALAFGLGMALGNFVPVTVYNWEASEATYCPVLKLNELESFV